MMHLRNVVRDSALLCLAAAAGWWVRGAGMTVLAQRSGSASTAGGGNANLAFQLVESGKQQSLTVYNPENRTLYVYPNLTEGNSHISCEYSFTVRKPGAAIERENCPVGSLVP